MIYHITQALHALALTDPEGWKFLISMGNLFSYITVRAVAAILTSFVVTMIMGKRIIHWLHAHNMRDQIKDFGTISVTDKRGTPTMGGLLIILATVIPVLLWCDLSSRFVQIILAATIWFGALGAIDDYLKVNHWRGRDGLSQWQKLFLQALFGMAVGIVYLHPGLSPVNQSIASNFYVPFYKYPLLTAMGWWYLPFIVFVVTAISNAVNLTDGMDGLAIMPAALAVLVYGIFAYLMSHALYSGYLQYTYPTPPMGGGIATSEAVPLTGAGELTVFCAALFGAGVGFLWYNAYPAEIIMGDTGSMALGGILACLAVMLKQEVLFLVVGGVFVAETLSSFIQQKVGENFLGRRIFYRAPLHHQMEYRGLAETKVVIRFWIISGLLALIALASLKIR